MSATATPDAQPGTGAMTGPMTGSEFDQLLVERGVANVGGPLILEPAEYLRIREALLDRDQLVGPG